jgi:hypothetical protein
VIKLHDIAPAKAITLLVYGGAGTGKTHLLGTTGSRGVILDLGKGLQTLLSPYWRKRFPQHNPTVIQFIDSDSHGLLSKVPKIFDDVCRELDRLLTKQADDFDTICVDDATALRAQAMQKGLLLNASRGRSKGYDQSKEGGAVLPEVGDYGVEMSLMEQFVAHYTQACLQAGKNFILVAHERITYNRATGIGEPPTVRRIGPAFTGQTFPDQIALYFDNVWQSSIRREGPRVLYCVRTVGDAITVGKTRLAGSLTAVEMDPDFLVLWRRMRAEHETK